MSQLGTRYIITNPRRRTLRPSTLPAAVVSMASPTSSTAAPLWSAIFIVIVLYATQVVAGSWYALCYFTNGDISPDDMPCSAGGGACCPKDWECLSNDMCWSGDRHHERHSCPDQTWMDATCPMMCVAGGSSLQESYHELSNQNQVVPSTDAKTSSSALTTMKVLDAATLTLRELSRTAARKQQRLSSRQSSVLSCTTSLPIQLPAPYPQLRLCSHPLVMVGTSHFPADVSGLIHVHRVSLRLGNS